MFVTYTTNATEVSNLNNHACKADVEYTKWRSNVSFARAICLYFIQLITLRERYLTKWRNLYGKGYPGYSWVTQLCVSILFPKDRRGDSINTVPCVKEYVLKYLTKVYLLTRWQFTQMVRSNILNLYTMHSDFRCLATCVGLESI